MDFFVYTTADSEGRIAEWADLGVVPEVAVHDVEGLKVGSLEDAMYAPTPKVVVIDVDWQVAPPYIAEEVERLVVSARACGFSCRKSPALPRQSAPSNKIPRTITVRGYFFCIYSLVFLKAAAVSAPIRLWYAGPSVLAAGGHSGALLPYSLPQAFSRAYAPR